MSDNKSESRKGRRFSELMLRNSVNCENHVCVRACFYDGEPCEYVWVRHRKGGREVCFHPWMGNCEKFCPRYTKWRKEMVDEDERVMFEIDAERILLEQHARTLIKEAIANQSDKATTLFRPIAARVQNKVELCQQKN